MKINSEVKPKYVIFNNVHIFHSATKKLLKFQSACQTHWYTEYCAYLQFAIARTSILTVNWKFMKWPLVCCQYRGQLNIQAWLTLRFVRLRSANSVCDVGISHTTKSFELYRATNTMIHGCIIASLWRFKLQEVLYMKTKF